MLAAAEEFPHIPICMHQDHGASPDVCQTFHSIRIYLRHDGRLAPRRYENSASFEYNVEVTTLADRMAHACGVSVEGELGCWDR